MSRAQVLALATDVITLDEAARQVCTLSKARSGGYVCLANVHMCVEAIRSPIFAETVNAANLVLTDGRPLALYQKFLGYPSAQQVRGEDLTRAICRLAAAEGIQVGFLGGTDAMLQALRARLHAELPNLAVSFTLSPPFRDLNADEERAICATVNQSGVEILFVVLGCPKQERWMARTAGQISAVQLGIGAAASFISGDLVRTPRLLQALYLEWLFRLSTEPRRLWRRYLVTNTVFIGAIARKAIFAVASKFGRLPAAYRK